MQVKCEVFLVSETRSTSLRVNRSAGWGAPTVGADLCVRPSSPERSLFCGRTRRSAPTQAASARQFHASNAVTPICRVARECLARGRPSPLKLLRQTSSTTDARPSVPTPGYTSNPFDCDYKRDLVRGPTHRSRRSEGQSPERPMVAIW